ncbi:MAG TPA: hypothetical protein DDZ81_16795 [Acetobacteraceae bacterium]|nr:hypothetical protein [Acetobacteraceae bacterium]
MARTGSNPAAAAVSVVSLLVLLGVLGIVLFVAERSPLKDDIAWLLYVARRWMGGRALYTDLIEVNPPLIIWISAVPIMLAHWLNVDAQLVAIPMFVAIVVACAWWSSCLLRIAGGIFADHWPVFALIGSVLLLVPAGDLGQREHLLVGAMLPYLVLFAREMDGGRPSFGAAVAAGILAGLGCALKPRYAGVFVVLECLALTGDLRPWRLMPIMAVVTLVGYAGFVAVVCPAYLWRAVPMALALYGATDVTFTHLLSDSAVLIAEEAVAIWLLWIRRRQMAEFRLMQALVVFAATSSLIFLVTGKDWYYHRLPATIATMLALILWAVSESGRRGWQMRLPLIVATVAVAVFCVRSVQRMEPALAEAAAPGNTTEAHLEKIIRTEHARTYVAFSEWLALGFPVVNATGVAWASRFDSMWALRGEVWRAKFDPATARNWPVARWVADDFIAGCPDIVVVDVLGRTNYIKVLGEGNSDFSRLWSRYRPIAAFDGLVVYRRRHGGCPVVRMAAALTSKRPLR